MPYIAQSRREAMKRGLKPVNMGELNYIVSDLCDSWLADYGVSYANINALVGTLECAKLELYARVARRYEDVKLTLNGDVYGPSVSQIRALEKQL